jgi:NadR type nicotinamide-nucleotide adenylyltransferase
VDYNRKTVPISGTQIRKDTFACREYLHPWVYRDLIMNVVFLGAPSTGKTTLASRLAQEYNTVWMPEYGREYWEKHQVNRRLSLEQLVEIASEHLNREEALLYQANRYLFTDTNAITTYMFSLYYHNTAAPQLAELANRAASQAQPIYQGMTAYRALTPYVPDTYKPGYIGLFKCMSHFINLSSSFYLNLKLTLWSLHLC